MTPRTDNNIIIYMQPHFLGLLETWRSVEVIINAYMYVYCREQCHLGKPLKLHIISVGSAL